MSKKPSADLCQILFETAGNAIFVLQNGQIVDSNAAACALFNYTKEGLKGKTLLNLSPATQANGASSAEALQEKLDALAVGQPVQFEWLNRNKKGQEIHTEIVLSATKFNEVTYVQASIHNISKYKEAQVELLDSERRLTDIINFLPEGTFAIDTAGKLIAWNKAMEDMTGIKADDVLGKGDYEYALPFYGERRPILANMAMSPSEEIAKNYPFIERDGESYVTEVFTPYFLREGGATVWAKARPLYDADGNLVGAIESVRDISERKQVEDNLAGERNLLRTLIDNLADIHIFVKDTENRFLLTNAAHLQTLGTTLDQAIGKTDFDFFPADLAQQYVDDEKYIMKSGQPLLNQVEPVITSDGQEKWYLTNKLPLRDEKGEVIGLVGTSVDITERRQAEQRVRQSEQRLKAFINALPDVAFIHDAEGHYLEVLASEHNPRYNQIESRLKGKRVQDVTPPEQVELFISTIRRALDTHEAQILEYSIRDNVWYEGRVLPIPTDQGEAERVVWLARDITDRKQAEQALQQSEQRVLDIIEFLPTPTFAIDKDGKVIIWNQAIVDVTGVEAGEILGKGNYEYALPFFGKRRPLLIDLIFESEEEIARNYTNIRREGSKLFAENLVYPRGIERYYDLSATGLYDSQGNLVGAIENFRDITEQKQVEEEVKNSLVRREREVQISGQVSQEIATVTNEEELYGRLVTLIREQFGYYNAQLYLYNAQENVLNFSAGAGRAGKQMQINNYQIAVGKGAAGAAAASGTPVLYRDVSKVKDWQPNPYLPNTQSEIALPIKLGKESAEVQREVLQYFTDDNQIEAIIVAAINPAAIGLITKQAIQKNKPVIACSTKLAPESQTSHIWSVEYTMGHTLGVQAGQWAKQHIPAGQTLKVGVFNYRIIPQVIERENGIIQGIKEIFGENVEIVGNETAADPAQASPIAERWLKAYPDMHMIVGVNDSAALGAYRAVIAAGKNDPNQFFVGGIDATADAITAIQSGGAYQATVDQPPAEMGVRAVRTVAAVLAGKPYPQTFEITSSPVNGENVDEFVARKAQGREIDSDNSLDDVNLTGVKVGVTVISLTNPFFVEMVEAAKAEANKFGLELIINDPKPVLGVLAAQSSSADGLDSEDQLALEGLSGQIAVAIQKIRLLDEAGIFRRLAEASGQGLGIANMDGGLIYINPTLSRIIDHENPEALIGNTLDQYYPTEMQQRIQQEVLPVVMQTGQWVGELALRATSGKVTPTIENFFIIYDENNQPRYIADLVTDITGRKQAETELETRLQELNALQRLMSREGWQAYQSAQETGVLGYLFDELSVLPVKTVENGHPAQSNASGNGTSLARPVSVRGEVIGMLGIYDDPDHPINLEEREFLDTIAGQVAEALERARLLEQSRGALAEVEQSQTQTERLYQANRRLSAAPDLQEAVAAVIEGVSAPDIDRGVLIIFERNSVGEIEFGNVVGNWHGGSGPLPTPVGTRYSIEVIQALKFAMSRAPFFFNDAFNDERVDPGSMEVLRRQEIRAVASLPLWIGDTQLGTLLVESSVPHMFTQAETEPFASLAAQLTVTVENRQLIEQTQAALAEIEATQRRYTVQAWESYRTRTVQQRYEQTREGVAPMGEETPAEVTEAVARKQTTAKKQMPALAAGNENAGDGTSLAESTKSSLTVPLTVRDQIIGVLGLQEINEAREWLPEEIALVEAIAEQMAQAAENIRLLDDTQQRASREQRVNEIGDKIRGAQSLEEALQIAVKEVGLSLQAPQTSVRLQVE